MNLLTSPTAPTGEIESVYQGSDLSTRRTLNFSYDALGNVATITNPLLQPDSFRYDSAGRLTTRTLSDSREISYGYDANGDLISVTPPGRPVHEFTYDPDNMILDYIPPDVGAGNNRTRYIYNADKQLTRITRPDGTTVDFGYNSAGRLGSVTIPRGTTGYLLQCNHGQSLHCHRSGWREHLIYLRREPRDQGRVAGSRGRLDRSCLRQQLSLDLAQGQRGK